MAFFIRTLLSYQLPIKNKVCQPRIAIEVLRRYLSVYKPTVEQHGILAAGIREFSLKAYKYLLESIGTSYNEVRMIRREEDKIRLAERLGIDYTANPEFLAKLFIEPKVVAMVSWEDYLSVMPGGIRPLLEQIITEFSEEPINFSFNDFAAAEVAVLREKLLLLSTGFFMYLAKIIRTEAVAVVKEVEGLNIPDSLREQQRWSKWLYNLSNLFSWDFREAMEKIEAYQRQPLAKFQGMNQMAVLPDHELAGVMRALMKNEYDFWTPFAAALKNKLEDFYLDEKDLEELFGLTDTRKDVFSDGVKLGDETDILRRWNIRGVQWGINTDQNGYIHLEMDEIGGVIRFFRNIEKNDPEDLVAVATLDESTNKFVITEYKDSGLTGELIASELDGNSEIYIGAIPLYLSWQLNAMRGRWATDDKNNPIPIIDPDLLGPADIKYPFDINTLTPSNPVDLWKLRKDQVQDKLTALKVLREEVVTPAYLIHGGSGSGSAQLDTPVAVVVDFDGNTYIADKENKRIQRMAPGGAITTWISDLTDPKALQLSSEGLIVLDSTSVLCFSLEDASLMWDFGGSGAGLGEFTNSRDLALSTNKELYVTDNVDYSGSGGGIGRIQRFTLPHDLTAYTTQAELLIITVVESAAGVKQVSHVTPSRIRVGDTIKLALEEQTVIYTATAPTSENVVKGLLRAIRKAGWSSVIVQDKESYLEFTAVTANTSFTLLYDNQVELMTEYPGVVAADNSGNLFLSDRANSRILKLDTDGKVLNVIGNPHLYTQKLVAMYRLDDLEGISARDSSGNLQIHNASLIGAPAWSSLGKTGGALLFDGIDDVLTIASDEELDASDFSERSIELWFKVTQKDLSQFQVLYKQGDHQKGLAVYIYKGRLYAGLYNGANSTFLTAQKIMSGVWHHICVVFETIPDGDQETFRLYLDGLLADSDNSQTVFPKSSSPDGINIGALYEGRIKFHEGTVVSDETSGYYFAGSLDMIRIWNRGLADEEINNLFTRLEDNGGTFFIPGKIKVDKAGNVYVADATTGVICQYDPSGNYLMKFGGYGNGNLLYRTISGLEIDQEGNIYVLDKVNSTIQKVNPQGVFIFTVGSEGDEAGEFDAPSDLAIDSGGFLYVADTGNNRIQVIEPQTGTTIDQWTSGLETPTAIAVDAEDNVVVITDTNTVTRIPKGSTSGGLILPEDSSPWVFSSANMLVTGVDNYFYLTLDTGTVRRFRFPQEITSVLLQPGITISESRFDTLWGIDIDVDSNLIVADVNHHRVLKLTSEGYYLNSLGKEGETSGTGEGEFNKPYGVATDESGNIYVADRDNNRVQKFSADAVFVRQWSNTFFGNNLDVPVALFIDRDRKGYIANSGDDTIVCWDTLHGIGALIKDEEVFNVSVGDLMLLSRKEKEGEEIIQDLINLNIDLRGYRQLCKVIDFAEELDELYEEHLYDLYNILLQVYKTAKYGEWKEEEEELGIILSQDFFILRSSEEERAFILEDWRATKRLRKDWVERLSSRIDIEKNLWEAHENMIGEVEDELYIGLRDTLIMATDFSGETLLEKSSDGSDKLLIDLKNNCCQRTTRISQAFETLQGVMWSVRTGLLQNTYPGWFINNTKFEEEWKWMGSYATWRAAQFVFMYPENILLPSYIGKKSTAFNELLNKLRNSSLLTPSAAYEYTKQYIDTILEVNSISLCGSIQVKTQVSKKDVYYQTDLIHKELVYLVGYSKDGNYFWASVDPANGKFYSDWQLIEGFEGNDVYNFVGLTVYKNKEGKRRLYLFLQKVSGSILAQTYYDLDKKTWNNTLTEIEITSDRFGTITSPFVLNHKLPETEAVHLLVGAHRKNTSEQQIFVIRLDDEMSKKEDDWDHHGNYYLDYPLYNIDRKIIYFDTFNIPTYITSVSNPPPIPIIKFVKVAGGALPAVALYIPTPVVTTIEVPGKIYTETKMEGTTLSDQLEKIVGVIRLYEPSKGYLYYVFSYRNEVSQTYSTCYKIISQNGTVIRNWTRMTYDKVTYINMYFDSGNNPYFIYQVSSGGALSGLQEGDKILISAVLFRPDYSFSLNPVQGAFRQMQLNPSLFGINYYNPREKDHRQLAETNKKYFQRNQTLDESVSFYVKEYQYLVPMYIAFLLNKRGYYQEALDWYRLVYDYSAKERGNRRIYYGLREEDSENVVLDDFEKKRLAVPRLTMINFSSGVANPEKNNVNNNDTCAEVNPLVSYNRMIYVLPADHSIDLVEPHFSLLLLDRNFVQNGSTKVVIYATSESKNNAYYQTYASYSAFTTGNDWTKLLFKTDSIAADFAPEKIKELHIIFSASAYGVSQKYYLGSLMSGKLNSFEKSSQWLTNPIDPHSIASVRTNSYSRYTIMSVAQCMLDYADSEYTQDNSESVPRARQLYETALDLLNDEGIESPYDDAIRVIDDVAVEVEAVIKEDPEWMPVWTTLKQDILHVRKRSDLDKLLNDIRFVLADEDITIGEKIGLIRTSVNVLLDNPSFFNKVHDYLSGEQETGSDVYMTLNADQELRNYIEDQTALLSKQYLDKVAEITGVEVSVLLSDTVFSDDSVLGQLHGTAEAISSGIISPEQITGSTEHLTSITLNNFNTEDPRIFLMKDLKKSLNELIDYKIEYKPSVNFNFCIPSNPIVTVLRMKAELNLFKIRNCRNIAGVVRELDPFAAPIDAVTGIPSIGPGGTIQLPGTAVLRPTIYRYQTLVERAKQLVQLAQQVEASMLATLEKLDAERYSLLKAKQDLALSKAGIKLQDLRVKESMDSIKLAELQRDRAQLQADELQEMIDSGLNGFELSTIEAYDTIAMLSNIRTTLDTAKQMAELMIGVFSAGMGAVGAAAAAAGGTLALIARASAEAGINNANRNAQVFGLLSSFERRRQEWEFQKVLTGKDIEIGNQQVKIANDHLAVVGQERQISQLQADHAQATVDFLNNKFTNAELYDWMSGILEGVYSFFLQQSTAIAKLAQTQLAFERQEVPSDFIKNDYWTAPADNLLQSGSGEDTSTDRKGLTGSTRLLQDIFQLDQFAFNTDKRKLELTKTISLATMFPSEFQRFKETGVLYFETNLKHFDRDFPGHYLRLIRKVSTSVIALIPPTEGIKATLSNLGVTYAVTGGMLFQKVPVVRSPESVALTSTTNATGLFELDPLNTNDKLFPFENTGVEGRWIFSMPKASNFFDYSTIADVLFTMEYTALSDDFYRMQVVEELDVDVDGERPFSFRNQFADQWYDLNNPDQTSTPMKVTFTVTKQDFPANIRELKIRNLMMYFVKSDEMDPLDANDEANIIQINELPVEALRYTPKGSKTSKEVKNATARDAIISTRKNNGAGWASFIGTGIEGTWELEFKQEFKGLFQNAKITDILFVIGYKGEAPEWPK